MACDVNMYDHDTSRLTGQLFEDLPFKSDASFDLSGPPGEDVNRHIPPAKDP
jgi:hypothetical protein